MKKILCLFIIVAIVCSGCALAAGVLAGRIAGEVINKAGGIVKRESNKEAPKYQGPFRADEIPDIK